MMDLAFLNSLTNAQRAALAILAEDLQNFGMTDSLGNHAIGLQNMVKTPEAAKTTRQPTRTVAQPQAAPVAKPKPAATLSPAAAPAAKPSAKPFVLAEYLKVIEGTLPFTVVLSATDGQNLWQDPEETLWQNMMKAIGFEGQNPTFQLLLGDAAQDGSLPSNHEASLRTAMLQQLPPQPVLVMGHRALQVLSAGEGNAAAVRRKEWQLKMPENSPQDNAPAQKKPEKDCFFALVATYHGHTLLHQPFLKRQTWADLLTLKQILEEGQV